MKLHVLAPLFLQKLIWIPTRFMLVVFGSLTIKGLENIRTVTTPVIFAVNHSSEIDPFMVPAALPFWSRFSPLFYAVREKEFYDDKGWLRHLFASWFIALWGGYGAQVGLRDYEKSLAKHVELLQGGASFCIFPEGRITKSGQLLEGKGGISFLAHSAPCTIIPVGVSNVYRMSPLDFFLRRRKITIHFGKPIKSNDLYKNISQPHEPGKSVWKEEADFIMKKIGELLMHS